MLGLSPISLILGAGPKVGLPTAKTFASKGYRVAIAARPLKDAETTDSLLHIKSEFADTDHVVNAFRKVEDELGVPNIVIYNGTSRIEGLWPRGFDQLFKAGAATFAPPRTTRLRSLCMLSKGHYRQQRQRFCGKLFAAFPSSPQTRPRYSCIRAA